MSRRPTRPRRAISSISTAPIRGAPSSCWPRAPLWGWRSLVTVCSPPRVLSPTRLPPEDIALVNQKPIYRSDFLIQTQTLYGVPFEQTTHEQRRKVLEDMIDEELMVQRGIEGGSSWIRP